LKKYQWDSSNGTGPDIYSIKKNHHIKEYSGEK